MSVDRLAFYDQRQMFAREVLADMVDNYRQDLAELGSDHKALSVLVRIIIRGMSIGCEDDYKLALASVAELLGFAVQRLARDES